jgi:hypothetical protein
MQHNFAKHKKLTGKSNRVSHLEHFNDSLQASFEKPVAAYIR